MASPLAVPILEPSHGRPQSDDRMMITPPRTSPQPALPLTPGEIDVALYDITPGEDTVVRDSRYNFPALGIIVNTAFKAVICMECGEALDPVSICTHTRLHNPHNRPLPTIVEDLRERYGIVALNEIPYASEKVYPVFGVPIEPHLLQFCGECHRGYSSLDSLRGHQSSGSRCHVPLAQRSSYLSYGQKLTKGPHRRYFSVDVSRLSRRQDIAGFHSGLFKTTMPPPPDFSTLPVQDLEDHQNLGSFLHRAGWLDALTGFTPADTQEATRLPDVETELWGKQLQDASHRALATIQPLIQRHFAFGLTREIAQVNRS